MRKSLCLLLSVVVVATAALSLPPFQTGSLQAAVKKPAIPKFKLQYWDVPGRVGNIAAWKLNNLGQIVGHFDHSSGETHIFLYDPAISPTTAIDVSEAVGGAGLPDGWEFRGGKIDINDNGVILGTLSESEPEPGATMRHTWAFVIDTQAPSAEIVPLPELPGVSDCIGGQINNNGDIVCSYKSDDGIWGFFFFNPAVHVAPCYLDPLMKSVKLGEAVNGLPSMIGGRYGTGSTVYYRATPELGQFSTVTLASSFYLNDMNDAGVMVGQYTNWAPMRLINAQPKTFSLPTGTLAVEVNNSNDVVFNKVYMYRDDVGMLNLKSYVTGSTADLALWNSASSVNIGLLNDRGVISKYGQVGGSLALSDGSVRLFLLTPVVTTR